MKFILLFFLIFNSCSDDFTRSKSWMWNKGYDFDQTIKVLLPESMDKGIKCSDYGTGCLGAFKAKVRLVEIILIEYESQDQAISDAKKLKQCHAYNWVFDDVKNEPVLIDFVKTVYQATCYFD